ncbi:MAG: KamA family radical SAM protein [Puniceicoccales bacterium]|jgi:lysine 2,3-aminomutase|nr:KamA family radical SAM protein [Puniceicoccales bacterium]
MQPQDNRNNWFKGQGLWADVPPNLWQDWTWQYKNRLTTLEQIEKFLSLTPEERAGCLLARDRLAVAITPYFFNLIDRNNPACPIRRQVIPLEAEGLVSPCESADPVGEENYSPVPGLVHRYPDRVLFLVTNQCASYCRYCTRGRLVSNAAEHVFLPRHEAALTYIANHPEVRDVLISGGDPLLLSDARLDALLSRLRAIPHVEFIRIGSRIPVFMPQRITPALCEIFRKRGPLWMSIHVNHPRECTEELFYALERISFAGVPLGNQSVLLRDINDNVETMRSLVHRLLMMRVRPYYLYACDLIAGTAHFRAQVEKGIELVRALRGYTSGYAVPQFVIDTPGGGGKVPINPNYVESQGTGRIVLRNFQGHLHEYPEK